MLKTPCRRLFFTETFSQLAVWGMKCRRSATCTHHFSFLPTCRRSATQPKAAWAPAILICWRNSQLAFFQMIINLRTVGTIVECQIDGILGK